MIKKIIGISGKIGSGKDTFSQTFAKISNQKCQQHSFADKLREMVSLISGVELTVINKKGEPFYNTVYNYTQEQKNIFLPVWDKTVGQILQDLGTDSLRNNFDRDVFVKALFSTKGKEAIDMGHILLIPDVRFENECYKILDENGIVIRLNGDPIGVRKNSNRDLNHESEVSLDNFSYFSEVFDNSKPDLSNLKKFINTIIKKYNF